MVASSSRWAIALVLASSLFGCVGSGGSGLREETEGQGSPTGEGAAEGEGVAAEGEGGLADGGTPDGGGQGVFGTPCTGNSDCASGFCVHAGDTDQCTRLCDAEDCPVGWSCKGVSNFGQDLTFVCAPLAQTLCNPCSDNADCGPLAADLCLEINGDKRCARDCSDGRPCPEFYDCQEVPGTEPGRTAKQCLPVSGRCGCTAAEAGTTRPCFNENAFGRCSGMEYCDADNGWVNCTAAVPRAEVCDGLDNDCDGVADEGLDGTPCPITNGFGTCTGHLKCNGINGSTCEGTAPSLEVCDGIDNNCDGKIDDGLCYDGNPCTQDICDPQTPGGCTYPPLAGPCDDSSACTLNDHCVNGQCTGTPLNCDDNNPCTDDRCDPIAGCQHTFNNAPCETGNLCTSDTCQGGVCVRGGAVNCDDGNPCTDDRCDPATGCQHPSVDNRACDDDDPCTSRSICSGGECVGVEQFCEGANQCNCLLYTCVPLFGAPLCTCLCP